MKKLRYILAGGAILGVVCFAIILHSFDDPEVPPIGDKVKSSLSSCRQFAVSFKKPTAVESQQAFQDRFGLPVDVNTPDDEEDSNVTDYNYDNFTVITLDCSDDSCRIRCKSKF